MASKIAALFNSIAPSYDSLNHLFSLNIDKLWRKKALRGLPLAHAEVLDIACGTADLSIALARAGADRVVGIDISEQMLQIGSAKVQKAQLQDRIELSLADCAALPYPDERFQIATSGFGVRNFEHRAEALREIYRVLQPQGELMILEFSMPTCWPIRPLYNFYFKHVMPTVGGWLSGNKAAYRYFYQSVRHFPQGDAFLQELRDAGFSQCRFRTMTFGIATAYYAKK